MSFSHQDNGFLSSFKHLPAIKPKSTFWSVILWRLLYFSCMSPKLSLATEGGFSMIETDLLLFVLSGLAFCSQK